MTATFAGFGAILLWSCLAALTAASGAIPPFELAALTFAIGGSLGLVATAARGRLAALQQPWRVWALGVGGLFGYHALYFAAMKAAPPAQAGLIAYLWPLLIVLLSATLPGEGGLSGRHLCGAILGLGGVAVLMTAGGAPGAGLDRRFASGYGLALACAFVWSGYSVLSRRFRAVPSEAVAGFSLATAVLAALCHAAVEHTVAPATTAEWLAILGLGLGPVGVAFFLWDIGVKRGDIRTLGVLSYAAPVLSTVVLVLCGFAPATAGLAFACLLIVAGAIMASWPTQRAAARHPRPAA